MGFKGKKSAGNSGGGFYPLEVKLAVAKAIVEQGAKGKEVAKVYGCATGRAYLRARIYRKDGQAGLEGMRRRGKERAPDPIWEKLSKEIVQTKTETSDELPAKGIMLP